MSTVMQNCRFRDLEEMEEGVEEEHTTVEGFVKDEDSQITIASVHS